MLFLPLLIALWRSEIAEGNHQRTGIAFEKIQLHQPQQTAVLQRRTQLGFSRANSVRQKECCTGPWIPILTPNLIATRSKPYNTVYTVNSITAPLRISYMVPRSLQPLYASPFDSQKRTTFTLPIFSEVIPVPGIDTPDDGCGRNRILTLNKQGQPVCERVLLQGGCDQGSWVVVDPITDRGVCRKKLCDDNLVFIPDDGQCHDPTEADLCPEDRAVYVDSYGTVGCGCADDGYLDTAGICQQLFDSSSCPAGHLLLFDKQYLLQCQPSVCPPHSPVSYKNICTRIGAICDYRTRSTIVFDATTLQPRCVTPAQAAGDEPLPNIDTRRKQLLLDEVPEILTNLSQTLSQHPIESRETIFETINYSMPRGRSYSKPSQSYLPPTEQWTASTIKKNHAGQLLRAISLATSRIPLLQYSRRAGQHTRRHLRKRNKRAISNRNLNLQKCRPGAKTDSNFKCRPVVTATSISSSGKNKTFWKGRRRRP